MTNVPTCSDCGAETVRDQVHPSSHLCPEGHGRRCIDCGEHSDTAWMSGVCDACYRIRSQRQSARDLFQIAQRRRLGKRDAWQAGFDAPRDAINPFTDLSHSERCLLDSHPWLADLTKDTP